MSVITTGPILRALIAALNQLRLITGIDVEMSSESFTWQEKWLAIAPKPFSLLSILGSGFILKHILISKERRSQVYHHILIGLCVYDIISSFTRFWGTWAIPSGTPDVYLASGSQETCNAQAFLQQLGVAVPIYTAESALYYFLVVAFGWKERQLKKIEIVLHLIPSALGWASSIVGIATNSFSASALWCWYSPDATNLRFGFCYGVVWACIFLVCILMAAMYMKVFMQERKLRKYQHPIVGRKEGATITDTEQKKKNKASASKASASKRIAVQGILYSGSFILAWLFASWARIYEMANGTTAPFAIQALFTITSPLQGFFNMLVYFRPKYLSYRRDHPDFSICRFICDCGGLSSKFLMSSSRTSEYGNPAAMNDAQRFLPSETSGATKQSTVVKNSDLNGDEQHRQGSIMKVADKGGEIEEENHTIRNSTVRFADDIVDIEEEKVEETVEHEILQC